MDFDPSAMQRMMGTLSDQELAHVAQNPPAPMAQLLAIQALDRRKQMHQVPAQQPSTTVLEDRVAQSMPIQQSGAASDPIRQGLASIVQQQQPKPMAQGGPVNEFLGDFQSILPEIMAQLRPQGPQSPQDWMAAVSQFQGEDKLAPFADRLNARRGDLTEDRRRDRWLALAKAGLGMMGPGDFWKNLSRGGLAGLGALEEANGRYSEGEDKLLSSEIGLAQAQQRRTDAAGQNAFAGYNAANSNAAEAQRAGLSGALGVSENMGRVREGARDRSAANWRATQNDITILARQYKQANPTMSDADALAAAVEATRTARGGSSANDLRDNILTAYNQVTAPGWQGDPQFKKDTLAAAQLIMQAELARLNGGGSAPAGVTAPPARDSASGATAPSEGRGLGSIPRGGVANPGAIPLRPGSVESFQERRGAANVIDSRARVAGQ